jgi:glyoxylase-like metal-dependent hydrolase (beta-lactamase superfamily II)
MKWDSEMKSSTNAFVIIICFVLCMPASGQIRRLEGELESIRVRDNLYMFVMEPAGNVAALFGDDGVLLVDDQFAPMTARIQAAVAELSDKPVRYLLNSHWHGDHTGGNRNFGKLNLDIVAHENVRVRLSEEQFHLVFKARSAPAPEAALPDVTYSNSMTLYFNDEQIDIVHVPDAHTDGDSLVYFRNADVLHTGDAFINRGYPLIDIASGGTIAGQIAATQQMIDLINEDTIVMSGHGPLTNRAKLIATRDMLSEARARVVELIEQDKTLQEIKAANPLAALNPEWETGMIRARLFVTIIYQSETGDWEKPENMPLAE